MSFLKGFEQFQHRMEEDMPSSEETTVDVEVKVAEEVEAATAIVEEATTVVEDAVSSDEAADDVEAVEAFGASVRKYGLTKQGLELMNYKGMLELCSGVALPAVESLDDTGRNHVAAQAALEAEESFIKRSWEAIKKFFKGLWEKIKTLFDKVVSYITPFEKSIVRARDSVKGVKIDPKKEDDKKFSLLKVEDFTKLIDASERGMALIKNSSSFVNADPKEDAVTEAMTAEKNMAELGLEVKDNKIVIVDKPLKPESLTLKGSGWSPQEVEGNFEKVKGLVGSLRTAKDAGAAVGKICAAGIKETDSLAKSGGDKEKEKVKALRKIASDVTKLAGKVVSRGMIVPRVYISAAAACRACAA